MPRVSVLLPARDAGATIDDAITSILDGSYRDLEVIAVDDGSHDDTLARLEAIARNDGRVRIVQTGGDGIVVALTAALEASTGELIARQDADDRSAPERLERQVALLDADPKAALVACAFAWEPEHLVTDGMRRYRDWQNRLVDADSIRQNVFIECPVTHATMVARRQPLVAAGAWRDPGWAEDYDLFLRLILDNDARIRKIPEPLYHWRERPDRITRTEPEYSADAFQRARLHYLRKHVLTDVDVVDLWGTGESLRRWQTDLEKSGYRVDATTLNPRTLRAGGTTIPESRLPASNRRPLLVAFGTDKSRTLFANALSVRGLRSGVDFWLLG